MGNKMMELRQQRAATLDKAQALVDAAEQEDRNLTDEERGDYEALLTEARGLNERQERLETLAAVKPSGNGALGGKAPAVLTMGRGDDEDKALMRYITHGDTSGVSHRMGEQGVTVELPAPEARQAIWYQRRLMENRMPGFEHRAVTDSIMNITTAADGGNLVPTGFVPRIAERMVEKMLADRLGLERLQGTEQTIDFPTDGADPQVFGTTAEQDDAHAQNSERDALQVGKTTFTLVLKTKKIELSIKLLHSQAANLDQFIAKKIGDSVALTHNAALITEVAANGTALKAFAATDAIAFGELEDMVYHNTLAYYLEDEGSVAWVMRAPTFGRISQIIGDPRQYVNTDAGKRAILNYPVHWSGSAAAIAASAKTVFVGNWGLVGLYESPTLQILRDPYSVDNAVVLKYWFQLDYGVLQAGAVGYGAHPTA